MSTDRKGWPLPVSSPVESFWGIPQELLNAPERLPQLAKALGVPQDQLTRKLGQRSDKEFIYLKRRINPDEARAILALDIPGVSSQREFRRFYPQGRSEEHTSELQSLMRISYAVFCLKKKKITIQNTQSRH